jgi:hypothetical protein
MKSRLWKEALPALLYSVVLLGSLISCAANAACEASQFKREAVADQARKLHRDAKNLLQIARSLPIDEKAIAYEIHNTILSIDANLNPVRTLIDLRPRLALKRDIRALDDAFVFEAGYLKDSLPEDVTYLNAQIGFESNRGVIAQAIAARDHTQELLDMFAACEVPKD